MKNKNAPLKMADLNSILCEAENAAAARWPLDPNASRTADGAARWPLDPNAPKGGK